MILINSVMKSITNILKQLGLLSPSIEDIIIDFKNHENYLLSLKDKSKLISQLKKIDLSILTSKQIKNLLSFLKTINLEEKIIYYNFIRETNINKSLPEIYYLIYHALKNY